MALKQILIVEDDPDIRSNLKQLLEEDGYPVLCAHHGQQALDFLRSNFTSNLGLIFLDLMMPVMDGPTFLLELEQNYPEILSSIPIFIITAGDDIYRVTTQTTGILKKPFDIDELSTIAARYCLGA